MFVPGFPDQIIEREEQDTNAKWYDGQVLIGIVPKKVLGIEPGKFADHPVTVGGNPDRDGQIVAELAHVLPCSPGNLYGNNQCGDYHDNAQWFPDHAPTDVLEQPENNMEVLHFPVLEWDVVGRFLVAHQFWFSVGIKIGISQTPKAV